VVYVVAKNRKDAKRAAMEAWAFALGDAGDDRAWCPGVSPPDNSCPPSNKGGGKAAGGKSAAGSGKKSKSTPPRRPTAREVAVAAREGMAGRQIAARKVVAAHFLHNEGKFFDRDTGKLKPLDEGRFKGQMKAIDWTKPVQVGPPPKVPPPKEFVQWQAPGNIPPAGGYFATPGTQPESLGIGRQGTAWSRQGQPVMRKVPHRFEVKGSRRYIQSTAARADDNWSIKGGRVQRASGGGQQWFVPDAQAGGGIDEFVFRGPSRSERAFCPGVSPPDNSCSPANKGDGHSGESKYRKASTVKEAEEIAKSFAGSVSYRGIDLASANRINRELDSFFQQNPDVPKLYSVTAKKFDGRRGLPEESPATYDIVNNRLTINTAIMGSEKKWSEHRDAADRARETVERALAAGSLEPSQEATARRLLSGRSLVDDSYEGAIVHEMGHHFDSRVLMRAEKAARTAIMARRSQHQSKLSTYASKNAFEYFAESYVAYRRGGDIDPELRSIFDRKGSPR
jgi:hypothetical protein